ncbi:hypothetical protein [uncultured Roseobacter sp.]|nr:hypothetical protein [uncultured Roseobacter sp.]
MNTTLAATFAPSMELGITPDATLPELVLQLYDKGLLARLTIWVAGISTV